jgi:hypothetical protein
VAVAVESAGKKQAVARAEQPPPVNATEALDRLQGVMLGVALPLRLARLLDRREGSERREPPRLAARIGAVLALASTPVVLDLVLIAAGAGAPYPVIAWSGMYVAFAIYLVVASGYIYDRLRKLGPWIDRLLATREAREAVAKWIAKASIPRAQVWLCGVGAVASVVLLGFVDHASAPRISLSAAWLLAALVAMFFAIDAVSWVIRFALLVIRLQREDVLVVHEASPLQTPAVRELRDFAATLAAVTGAGLFFFATPLAWAIIYVRHMAGADVTVLRGWSIAACGLSAGIALFAAVAPQFSLALLVGRQRDRILDQIDATIPRGDPVKLVNPEMAKRLALFDAVAATRTSTIGVTSGAKWALGLLAPVVPFITSHLAENIGLPF